MLTRDQAKTRLKKLGWSYRAVAPVLGVSHVHLAYVLMGRRESRRLMARIAELGPRPLEEIPHNSPYRKARLEGR